MRTFMVNIIILEKHIKKLKWKMTDMFVMFGHISSLQYICKKSIGYSKFYFNNCPLPYQFCQCVTHEKSNYLQGITFFHEKYLIFTRKTKYHDYILIIISYGRSTDQIRNRLISKISMLLSIQIHINNTLIFTFEALHIFY